MRSGGQTLQCQLLPETSVKCLFVCFNTYQLIYMIIQILYVRYYLSNDV